MEYFRREGRQQDGKEAKFICDAYLKIVANLRARREQNIARPRCTVYKQICISITNTAQLLDTCLRLTYKRFHIKRYAFVQETIQPLQA